MQIQGRASMPRAELGFGTAVWDEREHTGSALGAGTRICQGRAQRLAQWLMPRGSASPGPEGSGRAVDDVCVPRTHPQAGVGGRKEGTEPRGAAAVRSWCGHSSEGS